MLCRFLGWLLLSACLVAGVRAQSSADGWTGIEVEDLTPELQKQHGLLLGAGAFVTKIHKDGPANGLDLAPHDLIISTIADSQVQIPGRNAFEAELRKLKPGGQLHVIRMRRDQVA